MIQIDKEKLKSLALKVGIINPRQLSLETGVEYKLCNSLWQGLYINLTFASLTKIANTLGLIKESEGKYKMKVEELLRYDPMAVPPAPVSKKKD
jgi:hypothetical protein